MGSDQRSTLLNSGCFHWFFFFPAARFRRRRVKKIREKKKGQDLYFRISGCHQQFAIQELYQSELFQQTQWSFLPWTYSLFQPLWNFSNLIYPAVELHNSPDVWRNSYTYMQQFPIVPTGHHFENRNRFAKIRGEGVWTPVQEVGHCFQS